ncbi:unnamed protein product [Rhizophagus irregularis]|nr:unnamed protein product [Rhizophagus irregularis]CAB4426646.1 unnamed protein product [Rhizophagus irregularis]
MAEITSENIDYVAFSLRSKVTRSNTYAQIENKLLMKREGNIHVFVKSAVMIILLQYQTDLEKILKL